MHPSHCAAHARCFCLQVHRAGSRCSVRPVTRAISHRLGSANTDSQPLSPSLQYTRTFRPRRIHAPSADRRRAATFPASSVAQLAAQSTAAQPPAAAQPLAAATAATAAGASPCFSFDPPFDLSSISRSRASSLSDRSYMARFQLSRPSRPIDPLALRVGGHRPRSPRRFEMRTEEEDAMVTANGPVPSAVACGRGVAPACPSLSSRTSIVGDPASQRRSVIPRRSITLPHTPSGSSRGLTRVALSRSLTTFSPRHGAGEAPWGAG